MQKRNGLVEKSLPALLFRPLPFDGLGKWASEEYRIAGEKKIPDGEEGDEK
jgi:hypothetical protein